MKKFFFLILCSASCVLGFWDYTWKRTQEIKDNTSGTYLEADVGPGTLTYYITNAIAADQTEVLMGLQYRVLFDGDVETSYYPTQLLTTISVNGHVYASQIPSYVKANLRLPDGYTSHLLYTPTNLNSYFISWTNGAEVKFVIEYSGNEALVYCTGDLNIGGAK